MIKYQSFAVDDVEKINNFLSEYAMGISRDGIAYIDGKICILYADVKDGDREKTAIENSIKQGITETLLKVAESDVDLFYWQKQNFRANPKAPQMIIDIKQNQRELLDKIEYSKTILASISDGTWLEKKSELLNS